MIRREVALVLCLIAVPLPCAAQEVDVRPVLVSAAGGNVAARDGLISMYFAAGAVSSDRVIPIGSNPIAPSSPTLCLDSPTTIGLPGTSFANVATLRFHYNLLSLPSGASETSLRIYRLANHRWTLVPACVVDTASKFVRAPISSGGTYALAAASAASLPLENRILFRQVVRNQGSDGLGIPVWFWSDPNPILPNAIKAVDILSTECDVWSGSVLSPNENGVLFSRSHSAGGDYYLANLDGTRPVRVTNLAYSSTSGACFWSGGQYIAFTARVGGVWRLYKMPAEGVPAPVATLPSDPTCAPAYSPSGAQIAVGHANGILLYNATTGLVERTMPGASSAVALEYSPDGTKLGVLLQSPGSSSPDSLMSVNPSTLASQTLSRCFGRCIGWDPTSAKLLYAQDTCDVFSWTPGTGANPRIVMTEREVSTLIWR